MVMDIFSIATLAQLVAPPTQPGPARTPSIFMDRDSKKINKIEIIDQEIRDMAKAKELHYKMRPLMDALFFETNPIPSKAALSMMGKIEYELRLPLCRMSDANYERLRKVMLDYGLI